MVEEHNGTLPHSPDSQVLAPVASGLLGSPARRGRRAQITQIFQNPEQFYRIENQSPISHRVSHESHMSLTF